MPITYELEHVFTDKFSDNRILDQQWYSRSTIQQEYSLATYLWSYEDVAGGEAPVCYPSLLQVGESGEHLLSQPGERPWRGESGGL